MTREIKTDIIPYNHYFVKVQGDNTLDKKAICIFIATGFFLDNDTYWKNVKTLKPGTINKIDENGYLISSDTWFNWHYTPRKITFNEAVNEFTELFDTINKEELGEKKVILPISGGLDSRSQVVSLLNYKDKVSSYSYSFTNGYNESEIAKRIAKKAKFKFEKFLIPKSYLWNSIDKAAKINKCYSEFTHCRQLGVLDEIGSKGEIFSLGHWGDVLFDKVTNKELSLEGQIDYLLKSVVKPNGIILANKLWKSWNLEGDFTLYLKSRIQNLLKEININNTNAKLRAFKSLYWAPRWTSTNLNFFTYKQPISLPYYNNKICEFICSIPEDYLADRKIQIAYIKSKSPEIGKITWQDKRPFNLYNYHLNRMPYNIPYKVFNKLKREINSIIGNKYVQRNWELQFLGKNNFDKLTSYINSSSLTEIVNEKIIDETIQMFMKGNQKHTSHSLSMLLTLSVFSNHFLHNKEEHIKND